MENVNELKEYLKYLRAIVYAHLEDSRRYMDVFKVVYEKLTSKWYGKIPWN